MNQAKGIAKTYGKVRSYSNLASGICISIVLFIIANYVSSQKVLLTGKTTAVYKKDCDTLLLSTTGSSIGSAIESSTGSTIGSSIGSAIGSSIGSAIESSTGSAIESSTGSVVTKENYCNQVNYLEYTIDNKLYKTIYTLPKNEDNPRHVGETLDIRYNPNDPSQITHNMISKNTTGKILYAIGCFILVISIGQFIFCQTFPTACGVGYIASNVSSAIGGRGKRPSSRGSLIDIKL